MCFIQRLQEITVTSPTHKNINLSKSKSFSTSRKFKNCIYNHFFINVKNKCWATAAATTHWGHHVKLITTPTYRMFFKWISNTVTQWHGSKTPPNELAPTHRNFHQKNRQICAMFRTSRKTRPSTFFSPTSGLQKFIPKTFFRPTQLYIVFLFAFFIPSRANRYDLPLPVLPGECPVGFIRLPNSRHCYGFQVGAPHDNLQTWKEAETSCRRDGGDLTQVPMQSSGATAFLFLRQKASQMSIPSAWVARPPVVARMDEQRPGGNFSNLPKSHIWWVKKWNTRVTLILLTPPCRFGHWAKQKILLIEKWRGKTETGRKREKVGQLCPSTKTEAAQGWAMINCTHLLNQSIKQWLHHHVKPQSYQKTLSNWILPMAKILHWITQALELN